jgi:hypothetical protein
MIHSTTSPHLSRKSPSTGMFFLSAELPGKVYRYPDAGTVFRPINVAEWALIYLELLYVLMVGRVWEFGATLIHCSRPLSDWQ